MVNACLLFGKLLLLTQLFLACGHESSKTECPIAPSNLHQSLLQRSAGRHVVMPAGMPGLLSAKDALPSSLHERGIQLFSGEDALDEIVMQSTCTPMLYANVSMQICTADADDASKRLPGEDGVGYGLDTLMDLRSNSTSMVNIADIGGSYGTVTIAAFKKYPDIVRAVVAEPVPATFFFMMWNLLLNGIPILDETEFRSNTSRAGVVVLHRGVTGSAESLLRFCSPPWASMNTYLSFDDSGCKCLDDETPCYEVETIHTDEILSLFGSEDISLLKLDCEGCEQSSLPAISESAESRIKRLVGELHTPDPSLVQLACKYDGAKFLTAYCDGGVGRVEGAEICERCAGTSTDTPTDTDTAS